MAATSYDLSLERLLVHEGGYSNHPKDPGGPTNFGITLTDFRKHVDPAGSAADLRVMPVEQAKRIYRAQYWDALRCDKLASGVDYAVFDYGVNSGIGRSAKVLQRLVGVSVDGKVGPQTIVAANTRDPKVLVGAICDERLAFLRGLSTWTTFGKGWSRRVADVRAAALAMGGKAQGVVASEQPEPISAGEGVPPWLARQTALLGLYEFAGASDNPAIIAMARACGGKIQRTYLHDSIAWCALNVNYCLIASGLSGNDSLWALDFRNYGIALSGPAVGAIATKTRAGGGHVFFVVGRTRAGGIVGRGGNQSDMVCDEVFDPAACRFNWPAQYPRPARVGLETLPVCAPAPKAKRSGISLPPARRLEQPAKGVVPPPSLATPIAAAASAGAVAGASGADWVLAHPWQAGALAALGLLLAAAAVLAAIRLARSRQEAPTSALVPVAV